MTAKSAAAVSILLLAACNNGGNSSNTAVNAAAPEPAAKIVAHQPAPPPANAAAAAPDLEGARVLIGQLYMPYTRGQSPNLGRGIYTPELSVAIARQSDGEAGLGYDPFCRCQDFENFRYTIQSVEPRPGGATARIAFTNLGESHIVTLLLDYRGDRWLVADIREGSDSLLAGGRQQR